MVRIAGLGLLASLLAWFGLPAATPLQSASFDCASARHPLEKTICASPKLSALDGEVAALYKARLAQLFDKASFRSQQRDWQQILRARCAKSCDASAVETDYRQQRDLLDAFDRETWEASYKTADVATLTITHIDGNAFDFALVRDRDGETLCRLPANDGEAGAVATRASPAKASWSAGACRIDFSFTRDRTGHVTRLDTNASAGCKRYCRGNYGLSDNFLPANNWVAGNQ
ncbi:lysozyme inhibitor LprI family protein [Sphingomonas sp. DG1-23]|nr:lysozyme inhibitor LprI family protein [Sphingomonas sp. DG1-23]